MERVNIDMSLLLNAIHQSLYPRISSVSFESHNAMPVLQNLDAESYRKLTSERYRNKDCNKKQFNFGKFSCLQRVSKRIPDKNRVNSHYN